MDSMCYVNETYNVTGNEAVCKTHCTPYEIVSCNDDLKDGH